MAAQFDFTENQAYSFICGWIAGQRLKDLNANNVEYNTTLKPINSGGEKGNIGIALPFLKYEEDTEEYVFPVYTHDVDIDYSGFSVNIKLDTTKLRFIGVSQGDFGTIGVAGTANDIQYQYSNGVLRAMGLHNSATKFNTTIILFYITVKVISKIYGGDPAILRFNSTSYQNPAYTTLIKYVEVDGKQAPYYITPLNNISGGLETDIPYTPSAKDEEWYIPTTVGEPTAIGVSPCNPVILLSNSYIKPYEKTGVLISYHSGAVTVWAMCNSGAETEEMVEVINEILDFMDIFGLKPEESFSTATELMEYIRLQYSQAVEQGLPSEKNWYLILDFAEPKVVALGKNAYYEAFNYDTVVLTVEVGDPGVENFTEFQNAYGDNGFNISVQKGESETGNVLLTITAKREFISNKDESSLGLLRFKVTRGPEEGSFTVPLIIQEAYFKNSQTGDIKYSSKGNGHIFWNKDGPATNPPETVIYKPIREPSYPGEKVPFVRDWSWGGGKVSGSGTIYSPTHQTIKVQFDSGLEYDVELEPGENEVYFEIPSIYPEAGWVNGALQIISTGYLLIPVGFEWFIFDSELAPPPPGQKMFDGLKFRDFYDVVIVSTGEPVNVDEIMDDFTFEDFFEASQETLEISTNDSMDDFMFEDFAEEQLIVPIIPVNIDGIQDEVSFDDALEHEKVTLTVSKEESTEGASFEDIVRLSIE